MAASSDSMPPVPSQSPISDSGTKSYFGIGWTQWFVQVKAKLDIINTSLVGLANVSGTGLAVKTSAGWSTRTLQGTAGKISVTNGDGVSANPIVDLIDTGVIPGSYTNANITVGADGRITSAANGTGGGGAVDSVFGRTGAVTAATGDYTFAQIGSTPTTLAGYGITDAVPATRTVAGKPLSSNVTLAASDVGAEAAITAGTTVQYWRGDKSWRDFATDVRAAVLTGLSTATSAVIAATDTVLSALGKLQAQITDNLLPKGYIDGLQMQWVSGTALTVTSGAAYIEGSSKVLRATSAIAKTGLSLTSSTFYHVYLYSNAGTPDIEIVTTAPAAAYDGTARSKTGDSSRRYLGSIKTDGAGSIYPIRHYADGSVYFAVGIDTFKVLVGNATTATTVSCSSFVPVTARRAFANIINNDQTHVAWLGNSEAVPSSTNYLELIGTSTGGSTAITEIVLDSSQAFQYLMASGASANLVVRLKGYFYER